MPVSFNRESRISFKFFERTKSIIITKMPYASALAPIGAESPVKALCMGFVPDLKRIAGYAEVEKSRGVVAPN